MRLLLVAFLFAISYAQTDCEYSFGEANMATCGSLMSVDTESECRQAAVALGGFMSNPFVGSWPVPYGCVAELESAHSHDTHMWFNTRTDGRVQDDRRPVCKSCTLTAHSTLNPTLDPTTVADPTALPVTGIDCTDIGNRRWQYSHDVSKRARLTMGVNCQGTASANWEFRIEGSNFFIDRRSLSASVLPSAIVFSNGHVYIPEGGSAEWAGDYSVGLQDVRHCPAPTADNPDVKASDEISDPAQCQSIAEKFGIEYDESGSVATGGVQNIVCYIDDETNKVVLAIGKGSKFRYICAIQEPDEPVVTVAINFPSASPTLSPTMNPTAVPTTDPTPMTTKSPTAEPSLAPTTDPSKSPTLNPTQEPTAHPSSNPTSAETIPVTTAPVHLTKLPRCFCRRSFQKVIGKNGKHEPPRTGEPMCEVMLRNPRRKHCKLATGGGCSDNARACKFVRDLAFPRIGHGRKN